DRSRPIAFVPVYVGYEKLIEGSTYIGELTGQQKQKESIFGFFRSLSVLRRHFGEVHVSFGDPILLEDYLAQQLPHWESNEAPDSDHLRTAIGNLGQDIVTRINRSEEHTSELQSRIDLVCRLLLEKKKNTQIVY